MKNPKGFLLAGTIMLLIGAVLVITGYVSAYSKDGELKPIGTVLPCQNGKELTLSEFRSAQVSGEVIASLTFSGGTAWSTIVNNTGCALPITISSYKMFDPLPNIATQQFYDANSILVLPGKTNTITVSLPGCKSQFDLWYGTAPRQLANIGYANLITAGVTNEAFCGNVTPTPTPYPTATPSTLSVYCAANPQSGYVNDLVTYTAYPSGGSGSYSYKWQGACNGYGQNCSRNLPSAGHYWATVTVYSGSESKVAHCLSVISSSVTPTPTPTPDLNVSCYAERSPINSGDVARFISNVSGGSGSYSYNWTGDCASTSASCNRQFYTAGTYTAYLTVYSNGQSRTANCSVAVASTSDLNVSCQAYPNPAYVGQLVNFNSYVSGGQGNYFYQWTGACSGSSSSCAQVYNTVGNYFSTLTVSSGSQTKSAFCPVSVVAKKPVCKNECRYAGQTRYTSSCYKQVCGNYDHDPCLEWSLAYYSGGCKKPVPTPTPVYKVKKCYDGDVYWFDAYGARQDVAESCNDNNAKTKDYCCVGKCYHDGLKPSDCEGNCNGNTDNGNNNASATGLMVSALARKSSDSEWKEQVGINSGKDADMMVIVANGTGQKISNVFVKGEFPSDVDYRGNLYIDSGNQSGDFQTGINLGEMEPGAVKTITFRIKTESNPDNDYNDVKVLAQSEIGQANDSVRIDNEGSGLASLSSAFGAIGKIFSSWVMWFILFVILLVIFAARILSDMLYRRRRFNEPVM